MSVLDAAKDAISYLVGQRPDTVFSATEGIEVEIASLVREAAREIAESHDWNLLYKIETMTGDGVTDAFPLPLDYDRLPKDFYDTARLEETPQTAYPKPRNWEILGGQMHYIPALGVGETRKYFYITRNIFTDGDGNPKGTATLDTDIFVLSERLLKLSLIWRWKEMKGYSFSTDLSNYTVALSSAQDNDKGPAIIRHRSPRLGRTGWNCAYPWELG